jgi:hypothetical protein
MFLVIRQEEAKFSFYIEFGGSLQSLGIFKEYKVVSLDFFLNNTYSCISGMNLNTLDKPNLALRTDATTSR